ncbi:MAG TPA: flavin reductase family protein [Alphaproteobacteria bacterium]|nr:flavin reductase family protein [Alphaproteobacteria bacterium]
MGCFATGVTVATTRDDKDEPIGITINSLTSVSLEPPLVLFCLDRRAHVYPIFKKAKIFAFNILDEKQAEISSHFADYRHHPRPPKLWDKPQGGCPVLRESLGWMVCKRTAIHKAGDHDIFIGEVTKLHKRESKNNPLLYFHSRYRKIADK